jgi:hypothetical protein
MTAAMDYQLGEDEQVTSVMAYTQDLLVWGDVISKKAIRVSTWLRTPAIPQFIYFRNAHAMIMDAGNKPRPIAFRELHLPSVQVIAFHIQPPGSDPLDYDPNEPNRIMQPVTVLVGSFRFEGFIRMSTHTTLERHLDVAKETFSSLYDIDISQPMIPAMKVIHVPYALLRSEAVIIAPRDA